MKKNRKHIAVCVALILISVLAEYVVYLHYDSLRANPVILNSRMAVAPVYNTDGSWLYVMDLEIVVPIYRLLARFYRPYTLDYLYIRGYGTFDFPDFCIGAGIAGVVLWMVPTMVLYYRYKRERTAGMGFLAKWKWEFRMSRQAMSMPFVKKSRWKERFEKWR